MSEFEPTKGVTIMTGDPKKAIISLSIPIIVSMFLMSAYNLIDAIWIAGLGDDALAATGFITPFFMILVGLSSGLGAGANSAISRRIGARDKKGSDNAAIHTIIICIIISFIVTAILVFFLKPLLIASGSGETTALAVDYGQIVFGGTIFMIFSGVGYGILRAEGDAKRAMYAMGLSAVINMVLDPLLIYGAGMGIAGAAWATVISMMLVSILLCYWLFIRRDTYFSFSRHTFLPDRKVTRDILGVGLPASAEILPVSVLIAIINGILVIVAGTDAVAVYTSGWRVVLLAFVPMVGISTTLVTVAGAAFGAKLYDKMTDTYSYSIKLGLVIGGVLCVVSFILAPWIADLFTYSSESASLAPAITSLLRVMCIIYIAIPLELLAGGLFQAVGKGTTSFVLTLIREVVMMGGFAYLFGITLGRGEVGVWWGIALGQIFGSIIAFIWAQYYIRKLPHKVRLQKIPETS